ncbi:MAG TPA: YvcK family protein [Anaerolineales bacterium]|nr:YvcK family protein [Anaerolineales bacterium]
MAINKKIPSSKIWERLTKPLRWLVPGLGVKRWIIVVLLGTTLLGVGLGVLLLEIYRTAPDTWWLPILSIASLRALSRPVRVLIFGGIGIGLVLLGIWGINRSLLAPFRRSGKPVLDELTDHRRKERGPRIVTIGGGHGLSTLLRGLKSYSYNITAVVTVADDGGSSGRIRRTQGIPPPGDIRNCLAALSNDEALMSQLFQYRFSDANTELDGHPFGNLFISALSEITGSFEEAVVESGRVLAVHGRVLPATLHNVRLVADVQLPHSIDEVRVEGESKIPKFPGDVQRVWLEPNNPEAYPQVIQSILAAELIIIGPGSLFTSILPNLLVPDIVAAIQASRGLKLYVCNVATQPGETDGYNCEDHIKVLNDHVGGPIFDIIVMNNKFEGQLPEGTEWVKTLPDSEAEYPIYRTDLVDPTQPWRHDSSKLARAVIDLYQERTGPLVE